MYKFIKKNQKKMMALFAVGLMVAFTLPTFFGQNNANRGDVAYGYIGNTDLSTQRVQQARADWDLLKNVPVESRDERGQPRFASLTDLILGPAASQEISNNSEMFALLQEEALRMGVGVSAETVKSMIANMPKAPFSRDPDGNPDASTLQAVHGLLLVRGGFDRVAGAARVSRPLRDHEMVLQQQVAANLVEFIARDYLPKLPATLDTKDLTAHFDKYKDLEAGSTLSNKWGFGYKIPNKVRVQYVEVEEAKVRAAVEASLTPFDEAKYYQRHPDRFPPVAATTKSLADYHLDRLWPGVEQTPQAARFFGHAPPLGVATLLGYDHYRDEVRKAVVGDRASELKKQITDEITATMTSDYVAFTRATDSAPGATPSTAPTTSTADLSTAGPPSALGPTYGSKEYLEKLALRIQEKHKVLPAVQTVGDLKTGKELADLPGIGKTGLEVDPALTSMLFSPQNSNAENSRNINLLMQISSRLRFGTYTTTFVEPLATESDRQFARQFRVPTLAVYQASPPLRDGEGNQYIYRVTEAVAAHPPKSFDDVKAAVEADVRLVKAYDLALADAKAFLTAARTQHLQPAADAAHREVVPTNMFGATEDSPQPDYLLPNPVATHDLIAGVYDTLNSAAGSDPKHPVGLIELKGQDVARVLVDEIAAVKPSWTSQDLAIRQISTEAGGINSGRQLLQDKWFRFDDLQKRLGYRPAQPRKSSQQTPSQPQEDPEPNPLLP